ncbi:NAD-dependent epimerase/dehydratase family protein [Patescibacteria group bacterium]|nr:NAD-dependent epimerase/dehydratase family protein [Patescibacteria group bacterium]
MALVVGAAGFLGSNLVDKLLEKGTQVIGVDNLESGKRENLRRAIEHKNFHLIIESAEDLELDLPRLDYIFIVSGGNWNLGKVLDLFKENKCKCLFISSIELYDKENSEGELGWLKESESKIARFASDHNLNARVLRLGPVYGPRMHFNTPDPLVRLIQQGLTGDLQKDVSLEFSSRAVFVMDVVDLMIRTIFEGSTAQKIFDGVSISPIKVSEIKQVLLDPVWYESRDFTPSELPPWPTPNLEKSVKFLNWHPKNKIVANLRHTLAYFKDNEIHIPKAEKVQAEEKKEDKWDEQKKKDLELFKQAGLTEEKKNTKKRTAFPKFHVGLSKIYVFIVLALVTYALIWPVLLFGWGIFTFQDKFNSSLKSLEKGEFDEALINIRQAKSGWESARSIYGSLEPVRKLGIFTSAFESGDNFVNFSELSITSLESTTLGVKALLQGIKSVTGETTESPAPYFSSAQLELSLAGENLSKAYALIKDKNFNTNLPLFNNKITSLSGKLDRYNNMVGRSQALSKILPGLVALDDGSGQVGKKDYLILLQDWLFYY